LLYIVALCIGLVLLVGGAELLVRGGAQLALAFRVPALVVGLTIVAFGTSTPELATSISAAFQSSTEMALANVNGSNIANILMVLGGAALVSPLRVERSILRREIPVLLLLQTLVMGFCIGGVIHWVEGLLLFSIGLAYNCYLLAHCLKLRGAEAEAQNQEALEELGEASGGIMKNVGMLFVGIVVLVTGAWIFIDGAVVLAELMGLSDRFIGLSVVALGTSAPELATAIVSAIRGEVDLAIGNAIGSNILNIAMVLGMTSMVAPVQLVDQGAWQDLGVAMGVVFLVGGIIVAGGRLGRLGGLMLLLSYAGYLVWAGL
jgi:cation:H+ antiporter